MPGPIFVTGGTGMVGHNVRDLAAERGLEVVAPRHDELDLLDGAAVAGYMPASSRRSSSMPPAASAASRPTCASRSRFLTENYEMGKNVVLGARAGRRARGSINLGSSCMYPKDSPRPLARGGRPRRAAGADQRGLRHRQERRAAALPPISAARRRNSSTRR